MNTLRLVPLLALATLPVGAAELPPSRAQAAPVSEVEARYSKRWDESVHGAMLRRILPPGPDPATLPEAGSDGARLLAKYCVQCHHLPSPQMHTPGNWPRIVERMVWRMDGKGNMGNLMKDMMDDVQAPSAGERETLVAYLKRHGQDTLDRSKYPDLESREGKAFEAACSQCHALPDPKRHTRSEWPRVVRRMRSHLEWVGVVETRNPSNTFRQDDILTWLDRHGRAY